jgi:hypothetical protein
MMRFNGLREENGRSTTKQAKHTKEFKNREAALALRPVVFVNAHQISRLPISRQPSNRPRPRVEFRGADEPFPFSCVSCV